MNSNHTSRLTPALLFAVFAFFMQAITAPALSAQLGADPTETVRLLTEKIGEQMKEIDRLLLETGREASGNANAKERLDNSKESSRQAVDAIDQLIEELDKMANQQGGGGGGASDKPSGSPPPKGSGQDRPQNGQQGARQENETPQVGEKPENQGGQEQPKPGESSGEQQPQDQPSGQPNGQEQQQEPGTNKLDGQSAPQNPTDEFERKQAGGEWGNLPPYLMHLKSRGSPPQIPAKYRRLYEAYLRQAAEKKPNSGPGNRPR